MASYLVFAALLHAAAATVTVNDPSDIIPPSNWAKDNAILADYDIPFIESQPSDRMSTHISLISPVGIYRANHLSLL